MHTLGASLRAAHVETPERADRTSPTNFAHHSRGDRLQVALVAILD